MQFVVTILCGHMDWKATFQNVLYMETQAEVCAVTIASLSCVSFSIYLRK